MIPPRPSLLSLRCPYFLVVLVEGFNGPVAILLSFQEVERKDEAMYGEKAEEAEELELDIDDLKTMYRQQVRKLFVVSVI